MATYSDEQFAASVAKQNNYNEMKSFTDALRAVVCLDCKVTPKQKVFILHDIANKLAEQIESDEEPERPTKQQKSAKAGK